MNAALLTRPLASAAESDLFGRLTAFYAKTGSPWLLWSAWPTPDLAPFDLQLTGSPPLMLRNPDTERVIPGKELIITEVSCPAAMIDYVSTLIRAYPIHHTGGADMVKPFGPGNIGGTCRFWNGYVDEACVAVSSVCVSPGVVVVTCVATLEAARGRGYGAAMTDVAARCAPSLPVLLTSSEMGKSVYERLGFRTISEFTIWESR